MSPQDGFVRQELDGRVLSLVIDRPAKKNALTVAMYEALCGGFERAHADPEIRVLLVRGEGASFTAGNDLGDFMRNPPQSTDSWVARMIESFVRATKPIVAAVEGVAIGFGTTMLLHCDLVYAAEGTRFQLPFVNLGLCPEAGSSLLLPLLCGHQRASELLMLGEPFGPELAHEIGLVNRVLPPADLHAFARERAAKLAEQPPASVRLTKQLLREGAKDATMRALLAEGEAFFERLRSPEAAEALQAFFAKRKPDFSRFA
jgi:enoyl-CoA hydratase/carnithine racemase